MVIHPPMLYLGFVSFVIPYAFAIAALITGRTDDRWIRLTRRWTLWAWLFLSFGLVLGGRWAYDVLGWGGYWGWDPVEIAAFMPWLTARLFAFCNDPGKARYVQAVEHAAGHIDI
jgi:cytochrome c-type biogenesis protein CcmF